MAQDLKLCYNYLMSLPKGTMCGAGERSIAQFAVCGGAQAVGASNTGKATQSLCSDVAAPLLDIITKCPPRSDGKIAGHGVANGNGDLVVAGVGREYKWGWGFPALPEARSVPETRDTIVHRSPVVPGPGMPSLADLNLTTAELYDMPMLKLGMCPLCLTLVSSTADQFPPAIRDVDIKNMKINSMKPRCFDGPGVATSTDELRACYNYLKALPPTQICPLTAGENTEYVQNGNSHVIGLGNVFMKTTSSLCSDVAAAVLAVIEQCPSRFAGMAAGEREVTGNPEFLVLAISKDKKM